MSLGRDMINMKKSTHNKVTGMLSFAKALCYLGEIINIIPYAIYKKNLGWAKE